MLPDAFDKTVTVDDLLADFVADMADDDEEISPSIFTCVDNCIDEMCIEVMQNETSIFENGDLDDGKIPFCYVIDKVIEKLDTVEDIADREYGMAIMDIRDNINDTDPDYCEGINFDEITPEDFQLYISSPEANAGNEDAYCEPQSI